MKPDKVKPELVIEYVYEPSQDAQERLDEAWDIIFDLIIKDFEDEKNAQEAHRRAQMLAPIVDDL